MFVTRETSRVEITIYPNHPSEFGLARSILVFQNAPTNARSDEHVIATSTAKRMGEAAGKFEVQIKSPRDLRRFVQDGDWIDVVFTRHEAKYHVMRGVVMTITQSVTASSGATESTYTLIGEEFSHIFATQGFWFDQVTQGDFFPFIASRVWSRNNDFFNGRADRTVEILLHSFLLPSNNAGAALWQLPDGLPTGARIVRKNTDPPTSSSVKRMFKDYYAIVNGYSHVPPRTSGIIPDRFSSNAGTAWELALEFADTLLCELYADLIVDVFADLSADSTYNGSVFLDGPADPTKTRMAVIYRDLPFPNTVRDGKTVAELLEAPYFQLPLTEVRPQQVASTTLSIHGELRKNMIFFGPALFQELLGNYIDMQLPLIDVESVKNHGVRRLDAVSRYATDPKIVNERAQQSNAGEADPELKNTVDRQMAYEYRDIVRDLHCMNHLYEIGNIEVAHSLPEARIGSRIRIKGNSPAEDFTAYIEGVTHNWTYQSGSRTSLTVSHGWRGTDQDYVEALLRRVEAFQVFVPSISVSPSPSTAAETTSVDEALSTPAPGDRNYSEAPTAAGTETPPPVAVSASDEELASLANREEPVVRRVNRERRISDPIDPDIDRYVSILERGGPRTEEETAFVSQMRAEFSTTWSSPRIPPPRIPATTRTILPAYQKRASPPPASAARLGRIPE